MPQPVRAELVEAPSFLKERPSSTAFSGATGPCEKGGARLGDRRPSRPNSGSPHDRSRSRPPRAPVRQRQGGPCRSEEHTSELQSLMRISYAVFCLKKKTTNN